MDQHLQSNEFESEGLPQELISSYDMFSTDSYSDYEAELIDVLSPEMKAEERITQIILAALRVEFGPGFRSDSTMVTTIKEAVTQNIEQQNAMLLLSNRIIAKKYQAKKQKPIN